MNAVKILALTLLAFFISSGLVNAQYIKDLNLKNTTEESKQKEVYFDTDKEFTKSGYESQTAKFKPYVSITPIGGAIIPLAKLKDSFNPGGEFGLDVAYRINREVAFYGKFGYYFLSSSITGAPVGNYIEATVGPRYYFTKPNIKSAFFLEGGAGAYIFSQDSYNNPQDTTGTIISEISDTKAGVNAGAGAILQISDNIDFLVKSKYHLIFTEGGSTSFIGINAGIEFKIR